MRRVGAAALVVFAAACAKPPAPPLAARLAARAEASPALEPDTRAFAALGARVTGSAACSRAEDLAASRLVEAGFVPVVEPYAPPPGASGERHPRNVFADLAGRGGGGVVLLAAHLDSVAVGEGAADDAVNVAALLAAARALRELAPAPRRTIRFAFFTGEEQRMAGSAAYVSAHGGEPHALAVVFDLGSGRTRGFFMNGRKEPLRELFRRALAPDPRWRALFGTYRIWPGCDARPFVEAGIPVLTADQEDAGYAAVHHTGADTVDRLDFASARGNAALAVALAWGAAEDPKPDLRRQTPEEVAELLERWGIPP